MNEILGALARQVLTVVGASTVATAGSATDANAIAGAVMTLLSVGWSIWQKRVAAKKSA